MPGLELYPSLLPFPSFPWILITLSPLGAGPGPDFDSSSSSRDRHREDRRGPSPAPGSADASGLWDLVCGALWEQSSSDSDGQSQVQLWKAVSQYARTGAQNVSEDVV